MWAMRLHAFLWPFWLPLCLALLPQNAEANDFSSFLTANASLGEEILASILICFNTEYVIFSSTNFSGCSGSGIYAKAWWKHFSEFSKNFKWRDTWKFKERWHRSEVLLMESNSIEKRWAILFPYGLRYTSTNLIFSIVWKKWNTFLPLNFKLVDCFVKVFWKIQIIILFNKQTEIEISN